MARWLLAIVALVGVASGCGNGVEVRMISSGIAPPASDLDVAVERAWAVSVGPCNAAPTFAEGGAVGEGTMAELGPGAHCFWGLEIARFARTDVIDGDDVDDRDPCQLLAVVSEQRTLPEQQGVVELRPVAPAGDLASWDGVLEALVPSCAPRRDPRRCSCPFSERVGRWGDAAPEPDECAAPVRGGLVAIAKTWACAGATTTSVLTCWSMDRGPFQFDAAAVEATFLPARLVAGADTICALGMNGAVVCGEGIPAEPGDRALRGGTFPGEGDERDRFRSVADLAIGADDGDGTTITCAIGLAARERAVGCRTTIDGEETAMGWTTFDPPDGVRFRALDVASTPVGPVLCALDTEGATHCTSLVTSTGWLPVTLDRASALAADDDVLCVQADPRRIACSRFRGPGMLMALDDHAGWSPIVAGGRIGWLGDDGLHVVNSGAGAPAGVRSFPLQTGALGADIVCGTGEVVEGVPGSDVDLRCAALGATGALWSIATRLGAVLGGPADAPLTPVCPSFDAGG